MEHLNATSVEDFILHYNPLEIEASKHTKKTGMTVKEKLSNCCINECRNYYEENNSCKSRTMGVFQTQQTKELESEL